MNQMRVHIKSGFYLLFITLKHIGIGTLLSLIHIKTKKLYMMIKTNLYLQLTAISLFETMHVRFL